MPVAARRAGDVPAPLQMARVLKTDRLRGRRVQEFDAGAPARRMRKPSRRASARPRPVRARPTWDVERDLGGESAREPSRRAQGT